MRGGGGAGFWGHSEQNEIASFPLRGCLPSGKTPVMLHEKIEQALNAQITLEGQSSHAYLAMAVWAETNGFDGTAAFLYTHAEEERQHMLKLMRFVNERGGTALVPALSVTQTTFNGLEQIFEMILEHETRVTASINDVVDTCLSLKDYTTHNFMQWYVSEQREEEMLSRRALELFDIIGEEGIGLWTIDQEIGKLEQAEPGETGAV